MIRIIGRGGRRRQVLESLADLSGESPVLDLAVLPEQDDTWGVELQPGTLS